MVKSKPWRIRVQRVNNNDGINTTQLWNNIKAYQVLVWDDDDCFYEYPDANLPLFFNPRRQVYHLDQNCRSIKEVLAPGRRIGVSE